MAHNIFDSNVVLNRQPAWHGLGYVADCDMTAREASTRISIPQIALEPAFYPVNGAGMAEADGIKIIVGGVQASGAGCVLTPYGAVTDSYHLFAHDDAIALWDTIVTSPTESLGLLGKGETLFLSTRLPSFGVRGDEVRPYLMLLNPCNGIESIKCAVTPIRAVCQNTVIMGLSAASAQTAINHLKAPAEHVQRWLREMWESMVERRAVITEALETLANRPVYSREVAEVLSGIYQVSMMPETTDLDRLAAWEKANKRQKEHQQACVGLFESSETITTATQGTAWGLYNAVAEYEDYFKGRNTNRNRMFGESAARKRQAFDACLSLVK